MNGKIITLCVLALVTIPVISATANELKILNDTLVTNAPIIKGPTEGIIGESYEYTITYMDPQGDDVFYKIYWGDCAVIIKDGPHKSGEEVKFSHSWCETCVGPGRFTIRVQAMDDQKDCSNWGRLEVNMKPNSDDIVPLNTAFLNLIQGLFERFPVFGKLFNF